MMKHRNIYNKVLPLAVSVLLATGCSSDTSVADTAKRAVALRIELEGISPTRAIMDTTLPDNSQYGIYVTTDAQPTIQRGHEWFNIPVTYQKGKSSIEKDIILDANPHYVYATYPIEKNSDLMTRSLEVKSQTDYLYGMAIDGDGQRAAITENNPVAHIRLRHAMALLRFNIFQDESNTAQNMVTGIRIPKDITSCALDLQTGKRMYEQWGTNSISCQVNANPTAQTVEMLVIPNSQGVQEYEFCVNGQWIYSSLQTTIEENNSYTFNVEIRSKGELAISNPIIVPREDGGSVNLTIDD